MDATQRARIRRALKSKDQARARFLGVLSEEHAAGATLEEISSELGTTKQAVWAMLRRASGEGSSLAAYLG